MTDIELSHVRVKRKGQVTIPQELRSKLGIQEGAVLEVAEEGGAIIMKPAPRLNGGSVVGEREYGKILEELDQLRRNWR